MACRSASFVSTCEKRKEIKEELLKGNGRGGEGKVSQDKKTDGGLMDDGRRGTRSPQIEFPFSRPEGGNVVCMGHRPRKVSTRPATSIVNICAQARGVTHAKPMHA